MRAEERGLHGPVRSVVRVVAGRWPEREALAFDSTGLLVSSEYGIGDAMSRDEYAYDAAGREIERRSTGPGGELVTRREYDAMGRLSRVFAGPPGHLRPFPAPSYRPDGSFTGRSPAPTAGPPPPLTGVLRVLPGSNQLYRMPGLAALRTEFSPSGRPHWSAFEPEDPGKGYFVFMRYGASGLLSEEFQTAPGQIPPPPPEADFRWPGEAVLARLSEAAESRVRYEHDAAGRIIRETHEKGGFTLEIRRAWDRFGNLISETTRHPDGSETTASFTYEFDSQGNWTRRTTHTEPQPSQPPAPEEREIEYW